MPAAPVPDNETERLQALRSFNVLDTLPEQAYDDIVYLASKICGTPIALMSLVDEDRQWFKARVGIHARETPRDAAFCAHAILEPRELLVVEDAQQDARFSDSALVTGDPNVRFYVGAPLVTGRGDVLGTLCVIDQVPRTLDPEQVQALGALSRQIIAQLELRRSVQELHELTSDLETSRALLERSNDDLERFAYVAAHDLKQPFRMVASFANILAEELDGTLTESQEKHFGFVTSNATRGMNLIDDLLAFAQLNNAMPGAGDWIDLNTIFRECAAEVQQSCPAARITCDPLPEVLGDTSHLRQLAQNLLGNAVKYNDNATPTVRVTAMGGGNGDLRLSVADDGIGIGEEHRERIFGMFARLHDNSTYQGTGIGLAICQRVMELHDGSIAVASSGDSGTVIACRFPPTRTRSVPRAATGS